MKNQLIILLAIFSLSVCAPAAAVPPDAISSSEAQVKTQVQTVIQKAPAYESRVKAIMESAQRDAKLGRVNGEQAARKHPWLEINPQVGADSATSEIEYWLDSKFAADGILYARLSPLLLQNWSCFEPKLIAYGNNVVGGRPEIVPAFSDLGQTCARRCFDTPFWPPFLPPPLSFLCVGGVSIGFRNDAWAVDSCGSIFEDDQFEVIEFWWPEHQVSLNNYGISRLDPTQQADPKGQSFSRQALLASKRSNEQEMLQSLQAKYPYDKRLDTQALERIRQDPLIGQSMWGGFFAPDYQDRFHAHGYRTRIGYRLANERPAVPWYGWQRDRKRSIRNAFPPRTAEKDILNAWTESGRLEALTSVAELSARIPGRVQLGMQALYGGPGTMQQKAKSPQPFWQSTGAMSYRAERWPSDYGDLKNVLNVRPGLGAQILSEIVYKGGHELFPLVLSLPGFGSPYISSTAIMARRALFIMGARELLPYIKGGERSRMNEYTVNGLNKSREVDKMSWMARPLLRSLLSGLTPMHNVLTSECFRSQKIPTAVDQSKNPWYELNLPASAQNYVSYDFNDSAFIYWNKRVACTCKHFGVPYGASIMDFPFDAFGPGRGSGDRPYGREELPLCWYQPGAYPQAFGGQESERCTSRPGIPGMSYYGLNDAF